MFESNLLDAGAILFAVSYSASTGHRRPVVSWVGTLVYLLVPEEGLGWAQEQRCSMRANLGSRW